MVFVVFFFNVVVVVVWRFCDGLSVDDAFLVVDGLVVGGFRVRRFISEDFEISFSAVK